MTFEEFFAKKKIDLVQLEKAEPGLFNEFKSHYALMGEKSFDHTKKFWFNKLRHLYHLNAPAKEAPKPDKIASQAEPLSSPTIEQNITAAEADTAEPTKPVVNRPAFKPRNIPAKTEQKEQITPTENISETAPASPAKMPGFKPRNIKPPVQASNEEKAPETAEPTQAASESTETAAKPAFKPRFNMKNMPQQKPAESPETKAAEEQTEETQATAPASETPKEEAAATKPTGFKPRFNMKNMPQQKPESSETKPAEERTEETPAADSSSETPKEAPSAESPKAEDSESKPAFKPKFNLRNIKPKSPEE